eukprot:tig00000388_g24819.t1
MVAFVSAAPALVRVQRISSVNAACCPEVAPAPSSSSAVPTRFSLTSPFVGATNLRSREFVGAAPLPRMASDPLALRCMASEDLIEFEGTIKEVYPGGNFLVELDDTGDLVNAHLAGKLRRFRIKILLGDKVTVAVSPYDLSKGRIVFRRK